MHGNCWANQRQGNDVNSVKYDQKIIKPGEAHNEFPTKFEMNPINSSPSFCLYSHRPGQKVMWICRQTTDLIELKLNGSNHYRPLLFVVPHWIPAISNMVSQFIMCLPQSAHAAVNPSCDSLTKVCWAEFWAWMWAQNTNKYTCLPVNMDEKWHVLFILRVNEVHRNH